MKHLPLILAGPIVRRCEPTAITIWLALRAPCVVELSVFKDANEDEPVLVGQRSTLKLGEQLHVVCVTATSASMTLVWGKRYSYTVRFMDQGIWKDLHDEGVLRHDIASSGPLERLVYEGNARPSFQLPAAELDDVRLCHGSCRKPHGDGPDALAILDSLLEEEFASGRGDNAPQLLLLTGDQIYADDVNKQLLEALITQGTKLIGPDQEKLQELKQFDAVLQLDKRQAFIQKARMTSEEADNHLVSLSEYYMMYLFAWSDVVWPKAQSHGNLSVFRSTLAKTRRALANVSTYMIFDDHEVTDDWYRDRRWVREVTSSPLGLRIVRNGLTAYALFQQWGNDPDAFLDGAGAAFLAAADGWDGTQAGASAIRKHIYIPTNSDTLEPVPPHAIKWHYSLETPEFRMVALDTRTRRVFRSENAQPGLLSTSGMNDAFPGDVSTKPVTLAISPTPVLGVKLLEFMQKNVARLIDSVRSGSSRVSGADKLDAEAWAFDEVTYSELLNRMSELSRVLVLSGDVHYGFAATLHARDPDFRLVNFVSSSLNNEVFAETASAFLNAFAASWRELEAIGQNDVDLVPPEQDVRGERRIGDLKFIEEILPDFDPELEILESLEGTMDSHVSRRLRGILGSANLAEIRFRGQKVEQQLHWQSGGERKIKRHLATLNDAATGGALETVTSTPPSLEHAVDELENLAVADDIDGFLSAYTAVLDAVKKVHEPADIDLAKRSLNALLKQRKFPEIIELCNKLSLARDPDLLITRYNVQALIETGDPDSAIKLLNGAQGDINKRITALEELSAPAVAHKRIMLRRAGSQVEGLLGRAYIQQYISASPSEMAPQTELGKHAEKYFHDVYRADPAMNLRHGINFIAIRRHQRSILTPKKAGIDECTDEVARQILATLEVLRDQGLLTTQDRATHAEVLIALGRYDEAYVALDSYLAEATPYARTSTKRLWAKLWRLNEDNGPGKRLLARFDEQEKSGIVEQWSYATVPTGNPTRLESILGRAVSSHGLERGSIEEARESLPGKLPKVPDQLQGRYNEPKFTAPPNEAFTRKRARSVARIGREVYSGLGSGFLFDGRWIWPDYSGPPLLLTNAHVCSHLKSEINANPPSLDPQYANVAFLDSLDKRSANVIVHYVESIWSSPRNELDASILMLASRPWGVEEYPLSESAASDGDKASLIGYPLGGAKWYSVEGNVEEVGEKYFYYKSATEPGSSGSPVFNDDWDLIGLHRASNEAKQLNYGIRIDKILSKARQDLLAELGSKGPLGFRDT